MKRTAAVILAAGASTRLGKPKQMELLGGETLLDRAVRLATEIGCDPVVVVLGASADAIQAQCALRGAQVLFNGEWAEGMGSSVRVGVGALEEEIEAAVLMVCDQPAVTHSHLTQLLSWDGAGPLASRYAGRQGVPALFPKSSFGMLRALVGDAGARTLLKTAQALDLPDGELDIDTPRMLAEARARYR